MCVCVFTRVLSCGQHFVAPWTVAPPGFSVHETFLYLRTTFYSYGMKTAGTAFIPTPLLQLQGTVASNSRYLRPLSITLPFRYELFSHKHKKKRYLGGYILPHASCLQSSCPLSMINSCEHMKGHLSCLCAGKI